MQLAPARGWCEIVEGSVAGQHTSRAAMIPKGLRVCTLARGGATTYVSQIMPLQATAELRSPVAMIPKDQEHREEELRGRP